MIPDSWMLKETFTRRRWHVAIEWREWRWFRSTCQDDTGRLLWTLWVLGPLRIIHHQGWS